MKKKLTPENQKKLLLEWFRKMVRKYSGLEFIYRFESGTYIFSYRRAEYCNKEWIRRDTENFLSHNSDNAFTWCLDPKSIENGEYKSFNLSTAIRVKKRSEELKEHTSNIKWSIGFILLLTAILGYLIFNLTRATSTTIDAIFTATVLVTYPVIITSFGKVIKSELKELRRKKQEIIEEL